ncbi:MAG: helix-turn-helix domain-containing protein [Solirubrobacterales bacterium]
MSSKPEGSREAVGAEIDWERLARAESHTVRLAIIEAMHADPHDCGWSPLELSRTLNMPLSNISYHVACLHEAGLIAQTGTAPRRGAVEHFYALVL